LVVCGVDPLLFIASTLEVPQGVSEYDWAGGIRGEPYDVITEPITRLPMPASAEIVLAGFLHHDKKMPEGPCGEWAGYYASGERAEPVLEVEAIYHRDDPIILGVPPNKPPYEPHRYREYLRSALLLRELKAAGVPGVVDAHCFGVGGCRLLNAVSIEQRYAGHSRQAGHVAAMCRVGAYLGRIVIDPYKDWVAKEGIPVHEGFGLDLLDLDVAPWPRLEANGAFAHLTGRGDFIDMQIVEIPPGGKTAPQRHLYEEVVYVLAGRGSTSVESPSGERHSFEWHTGSLFAIPLNGSYRHYNGSGTQPARIVAVTDLPLILNVFR